VREFEITPERLKDRAQSFGITDSSVEDLYAIYKALNTEIKNQYLAHIIRAMEGYLRKETKNEFFRIICEPSLRASDPRPVGCAQYFHRRFFVIHFNPSIDERQLRVCLAHELGHLFLLEIVNKHLPPTGNRDVQSDMEPLSSIFGIFTMADKNDFYQNTNNSTRNHTSWDELKGDFKALNS
jgi:hypothetical protein